MERKGSQHNWYSICCLLVASVPPINSTAPIPLDCKLSTWSRNAINGETAGTRQLKNRGFAAFCWHLNKRVIASYY